MVERVIDGIGQHGAWRALVLRQRRHPPNDPGLTRAPASRWSLPRPIEAVGGKIGSDAGHHGRTVEVNKIGEQGYGFLINAGPLSRLAPSRCNQGDSEGRKTPGPAGQWRVSTLEIVEVRWFLFSN